MEELRGKRALPLLAGQAEDAQVARIQCRGLQDGPLCTAQMSSMEELVVGKQPKCLQDRLRLHSLHMSVLGALQIEACMHAQQRRD
jgi:hypothetical protein